MKNRRAFTMVELIVVMGIILVLITILVPVVSKVKAAAKGAENKQLLTTLSESITRYYADFNAYPGPLTNAQMETQGTTVFGVTSPNGTNYYITGSENLVLGLMGGLKNTGTAAAPNIQFDPAMVGQGPINLNPAQMKRYQPYVTSLPISEGKYADNASGPSGALDTNIPEFVDTFEGKMPILYLRARNGATGVIAATSSATAQYGLNQIIAYTGSNNGQTGKQGRYIGDARDADYSKYVPTIGKADPLYHGLNTAVATASMTPGATGYVYPYDAYPYFTDPNNSTQPRQKDGYILICAGPDGVYGTEDDITSFGSVR